MPLDRFLIAPFYSGLRTDLRPWLIPDDAFSSLRNAYIFRGRLIKRFGGILMGSGSDSSMTAPLFSRLRILIDTTDGSGDASGTVPGAIFQPGQLFSIADEIYTVYQNGAMLDTGATTTATFNTSNGAYNFVGATALTAIYFYPATPVMGICNYAVGPINNQPSFAFDTQFAYSYTSGSWLGFSFPIWGGNNADFFWTYNYRGASTANVILFVSNFNATVPTPVLTDDPIYYYDGSTWQIFVPYFDANGLAPGNGPYVQTARIIISFKNRLLLLNTIEGNADGTVNTAYPQRCRYSFVGSPFAVNAWYEEGVVDTSSNTWGGGGYIDATTQEQIVGAEFIKDRLIIYFERSTWELAYTGNQLEPFVFQRINTELGSEATFSSVPFDKVILTIGNTGVHACNGANVERIDKNIPQEVFEIENKNEGVQRVAGIRDYYTEMVYWTFPSDNENPMETFPNRVLTYNYQNGAWSFNDDCITTWGYFEQQMDTTWANAQGTWEEANFTWNSGVIQAQFRQVIAGNQQGFIFIVNAEEDRNAPVMSITNITTVDDFLQLTIIDHTLNQDDFILIENCTGIVGLNDGIFINAGIIDADNILIVANTSGAYTGGGTVARVSKIDILSKQFNPYIDKGKDVYIQKIDFAVQKTTKGQITVDYYPSSSEESMLIAGEANFSIMGTGILETSPYDPAIYPFEQVQQRLWHSIYFQCNGECIQLHIYFSTEQLLDPNISLSPFEIEGMILYTEPTGRLE